MTVGKPDNRGEIDNKIRPDKEIEEYTHLALRVSVSLKSVSSE